MAAKLEHCKNEHEVRMLATLSEIEEEVRSVFETLGFSHLGQTTYEAKFWQECAARAAKRFLLFTECPPPAGLSNTTARHILNATLGALRRLQVSAMRLCLDTCLS